MLLETVLVAFSMYSAIPMPRVVWNARNMRYALCAFPLIGLLAGGANWLWFWICTELGLPDLLRGAGLCLLPVWITGGIHLDGYVDTCDALSSHAEPARCREILKDPHVGAFAVIHLCSYFIASWAIWAALPVYRGPAFLCAFCLSRCLSGLSVLSFPLSEGSGLARSFSEAADKKKARIFLGILAALLCLILCLSGGAGMVLSALGVFLYYYHMARERFGGLNGDLAGWFLQTAELWMLAAMLLTELFIRNASFF